MKITSFKRFLLIAIAAVMVFSLFACGETPEEPENTTEEIVDPVESSDNKPQDSEEVEPPVNTESSGNQGGEGTEPESQETVTTETDEVVTTETDEVVTTETESDEVVTTETESEETTETTETETEAKPECQHTELTDVEAKAATCTEAGNEAYKTCSCGQLFDADGKAIDAIPTVAAKGHTDAELPAVAPKCEETGLTAGVECSVCHAVLTAQEPVPALGHSWDEGNVTTAPTCTEKGVKTYTCKHDATHTKTEEIKANGHTEAVDAAKEPDCDDTGLTEGKHCSVCNKVLVEQNTVPAKGHSDTDTDYKCDVCGEKLCTNHVEETITGKAATCTATGLTDGIKCSVCGEIIKAQDVIPAKGHTNAVIPAVAPKCEETGLTEGVKCSVCDVILTAQETVPALGHSWDEGKVTTAPTCTEKGVKTYTCKHDATHTKTEEVAENGHTNAVIPAVAPKCEETGLTEGVKCSVCQAILTAQETVPALGHSWDEGKVTTAPTCTEKGVKTYTCKHDATHTKTEEVGVIDHSWDEGKVTTAPTCTEKGVKTYTCKHDATHTKTEEIKANGHTNAVIPAVAPKCEETGLTEGVKCSVCQAILTAQETVPALGHSWDEGSVTTAPTCTEKGVKTYTCKHDATHTKTEEVAENGHTSAVIPAVAPKCEEDGLTEGVECSVCHAILTAQKPVPATGHNKIDKKYRYPSASEEGWEAHSVCANCDKVWDADGTEIDAVPTIAKIDPNSVNKYWGIEAFASWSVGGAQITLEDGTKVASKFKTPVISEDRGYVRFERDGLASDGNVNFMSGNTGVTGQYLVIKYRTDHVTTVDLWANTTQNGHHTVLEDGTIKNGVAYGNVAFVPDGKWHLAVFNMSEIISKYVQPNENGEYIIQWARIDLLNGQKDGGYIDLAYLVLCDDLTKVQNILQDGDNEYCGHMKAESPVYTSLGENHYTVCVVCGERLIENHNAISPVWNTETLTYNGTCACGDAVQTKSAYVCEAYSAGGCSSFAPKQVDGFVRYTNTGSSDPYITIYADGTTVTGNYVVIKYRLSDKNQTYEAVFAGSVKGDHYNATGGCDQVGGSTGAGSLTYTEDGAWHYVIIELRSTCFKPNEDGTYSCRFIRIDFDYFTKGEYIDIDEIAFTDNRYAADRYVYGDDAVCTHAGASFTWNSEILAYKSVCNGCGNVATKDALYMTEAQLGDYANNLGHNVAGSAENYLKATQEDGFVRYTAIKKVSNGDTYFVPFSGGTEVTGKYMIIRYRAYNKGTNMSTSALFASSLASGQNSAAGANGDNTNVAYNGTTLYADEKWHYLVIAISDTNLTFTPNGDGTYTWRYLRMRLNGWADYNSTCYFDIDKIEFVDNLEAAEKYIYGAESVGVPFTINLDKGNCSLNGNAGTLFGGGSVSDKPLVINAEGKVLNNLNAVAVGGWFVTPGGTASYKYRVVTVDGVAVENPVLVDYFNGGESSNITKQGTNRGWSAACGKGAGWQTPKTIKLGHQYEGKTVDIEVVAVTRFGNELVIVQINNVAVPYVYNGLPGTVKVDGTDVTSMTTKVGGIMAGSKVNGDLSGATVKADSTIAMTNGWVTTNGGWASYKYRITEGENVYVVAATGTLITKSDITADGIKNGFDADSAKNGAYDSLSFNLANVKDGDGQAVDLTGKTIKVEMIGVANNGHEFVICTFTNIEVQAA